MFDSICLFIPEQTRTLDLYDYMEKTEIKSKPNIHEIYSKIFKKIPFASLTMPLNSKNEIVILCNILVNEEIEHRKIIFKIINENKITINWYKIDTKSDSKQTQVIFENSVNAINFCISICYAKINK